MTALRFVSMPTAAARAFQAGAADANGQPPERHVADEDGLPCRHCQRPIATGEPYLILAYRPFPAAQPYAELGPIFLHAEPCERHLDSSELPEMFRDWKNVLVRGYGADDRIVYGTGEVVSPTDVVVGGGTHLHARRRALRAHAVVDEQLLSAADRTSVERNSPFQGVFRRSPADLTAIGGIRASAIPLYATGHTSRRSRCGPRNRGRSIRGRHRIRRGAA